MTGSTDMKKFTDDELRYSATARCPCGAGLAYPKGVDLRDWRACSWDCADILTGRAVPGHRTHTDRLPFAFHEIKSELQPSANGASTRPKTGA